MVIKQKMKIKTIIIIIIIIRVYTNTVMHIFNAHALYV